MVGEVVYNVSEREMNLLALFARLQNDRSLEVSGLSQVEVTRSSILSLAIYSILSIRDEIFEARAATSTLALALRHKALCPVSLECD